MQQVNRRRTFAIIAHPDAGKTTLTEKLLLFGGAIHLAGAIKSKKADSYTKSDWLKIERERGISVATSVMTFEYGDGIFNLLDTPGHEDFADDTYRTLSAVDGAVMVLDAAKGIEARTLKLFEVCRLRDIPIITFINKMDREAQDPLALLDEVADKLALNTVPMNWPVAFGKYFAGTVNLLNNQYSASDVAEPVLLDSALEASLGEAMPADIYAAWQENLAIAKTAYSDFCLQSYLEGHMTPVYFGSALRDIGVKELLDGIYNYSPKPRAQSSAERVVQPEEAKLTGFIFKIQANMDPQHRDRMAFLRVCSGKLQRGMKVNLVRTGKALSLSAPQFFFAQNRHVVDEAFAGDVVGIPNHGSLRIGDSLTEGEKINFLGVPNFAPEILRRARTSDALKNKKLKDALLQLAEEGVVQYFSPEDGSAAIIGVIGALQLDVLQQRLAVEYNLPVSLEPVRFNVCRWITANNPADLEMFINSNKSSIAYDLDGDPVFFADSSFSLNYDLDRYSNIVAHDVKEYIAIGK